jgi:hypothetical protein
VFGLCLNSCPADLSTIRHLRIENVGGGSALFFFGGTAGNPVSIDDVEAIAGSGSSSLAILGFSQTGLRSRPAPVGPEHARSRGVYPPATSRRTNVM